MKYLAIRLLGQLNTQEFASVDAMWPSVLTVEGFEKVKWSLSPSCMREREDQGGKTKKKWEILEKMILRDERLQ